MIGLRKDSGFDYEFAKKRNVTGIQIFLFLILTLVGVGIGLSSKQLVLGIVIGVLGVLLGLFLASSIRVANQWEKAVVLRLGKFQRLAGPGVFRIFPLIDTVPSWIDQRIRTTSFTAEQTLTKDTVPVDVDAVLFWVIWDAKKAALEVEDYQYSVNWAAQTALRDVIGRTMLADLLAGREELDAELLKRIDERTEPWGITVQGVKIRDISIPSSLQDAMSREAQAERERRARVILGTAEQQIADAFVEAADVYRKNPMALQLRAMNILYEGLKEKASMVVVPSSLAEAMNLGSILGLTNMEEFQQQKKENS